MAGEDNVVLENADKGGFGLLFARSQRALRTEMPTIDRPVGADVYADAATARKAALEASNIINETLVKQRQISGEKQGEIQRKVQADVAAQRSQYQQEDAITAINTGALSKFDEAIATQANQLSDISLQRVDLANKINENKAINFSERPFDWLMAQFETSGLINQHNSLVATENNLHDSISSLHNTAADMAERAKAYLPAHTAEQRLAGITALETEASIKKLDLQMDMETRRNNTSLNTAELFERNYQRTFGLDDSEFRRQAAKLNSVQEKLRFEADAPLRELAAMNANNEVGARLAYKALEKKMGIGEGKGYMLVEEIRKNDPQTAAALVRIAMTDRFDSVEDTMAFARVANERGASVPPEVKEIVGSVIEAEQKFTSGVASEAGIAVAGKYVTKTKWDAMPAAQKSLQKADYLRQYLQQKVTDKAASLNPVDLARIDPEFAQRFPMLQAAIANPAAFQDENRIIEAVVQSQKGNLHSAAGVLEKFNKERLALAAKNTLTLKAGVEPPKVLASRMKIDLPIGVGMSREMDVNWTDRNSIERMLRLSTVAKRGAKAQETVVAALTPSGE